MEGNNKPKRKNFSFTKTARRTELMKKVKESTAFQGMNEATIFEVLLQNAASSPDDVNRSIINSYLNEFEKINQGLDLIFLFMKDVQHEFKEVKREIVEIKNKVGLFKNGNPIFNNEKRYKKGMDT